MLKFAAFSVSKLEEPHFEQLAEAYQIEFVVKTATPLTLEEAQQLPNNLAAVLILPQVKTTKAILKVLAEKQIKIVATRSAGTDAIDLEAAAELGIMVTNVPSYSPQAIAEFALLQMLNALRHSKLIQHQIEQYDFRGKGSVAQQLDTQIVGIVGYGHIGQKLAQLLEPFGCQLLVYTPKPIDANRLLKNMKWTNDFNLFLQTSDIVSIHCPATEQTHHLFNPDTLAEMKKTAIVINTARGTIVDADAILTALDEGQLGFYAADVYEVEQGIFQTKFATLAEIPDTTFQRLVTHPQVTITPHIAFNTFTSIENMVKIAITNVLELLATR